MKSARSPRFLILTLVAWSTVLSGCGEESVVEAARNGEISALRAILEKHPAAAHSADARGRTPLHWAVLEDRPQAIELLLSRGADPLALDNLGFSPAAYAINLKREEVLKLLESAAGIHQSVRAGDLSDLTARLESDPALVDQPDARGFSPLHYAIRAGNQEVFEGLLEGKASVSSYANGSTPLHSAAQFDRIEMAQALLRQGANPQVLDGDGNTPMAIARSQGFSAMVNLFENQLNIHEAARRGNIQRLEELLAIHPGLIEERMDSGITPLFAAVLADRVETAGWLLDHGARIDIQDQNGTTPLEAAASQRNPDLVELLLERGGDPNSVDLTGRTPLFYAVRNGDTGIVRSLMIHGASIETPHEDGLTLLQIAAIKGNSRVADLLLQAGAEVDAHTPEGKTALFYAVKNGLPDMVDALLSNGARLAPAQGEGAPLLHMAATEGQDGIVRLLLKAGADVNERTPDGRTALYYAVREGQPDTVAALIAAGASVETRFENDISLLEIAAVRGEDEIVDRLLGAGLDVNARSSDGRTPLYWAFKHGNPRAIQILESRGAQLVPAPDSPLEKAILANDLERVRRLVEEDPGRLSQKDPSGGSPLHLAARQAGPETLSLLLELGADPRALDDMGKAPLFWAQHTNRPEVARILEAGVSKKP